MIDDSLLEINLCILTIFILSMIFRKRKTNKNINNDDAVSQENLLERSTIHVSVVDDYIAYIENQEEAIKDPELGLDTDFDWVNVNALLLIGCLRCLGSNR